ncbi:MAG: hypothetical protein J6T91_01085 [Alphaproteobacteria bacterium]|nr:hypothetical protein [Alphaproteobacteria bacterium]
MNKSKVIVLSFLLRGCTGVNKNKYVDEYKKFSCEELDREYRDVNTLKNSCSKIVFT